MKRETVRILALLLVAACQSVPRPLPPAAGDLRGHLLAVELRNLRNIQRIHEPGLGLVRRFRESGLLADSAEWWVAGHREVLPFAGTWRGIDGIVEFEKQLGSTVRYDKVEIRQYLVSGNEVVAGFFGDGIARATGKPFSGEIVRVYSFSVGRVVRVRNYYDTHAYVRAIHPPVAAPAVAAMPIPADTRQAVSRAARGHRRLFRRGAALSGRRRHYADALALWPDSLGIAKRALGSFWRAARYDDAYVWGQKALAREPRSLQVLFNVGVTCGFLVELDCVDSVYPRALDIDSTFVDGYGELAFLAQARGELPAAIRYMERAYSIAPTNDFAVSGLAQMLIPAGEARRARAVMEPRLAADRKARAYGGRSMLTLYGWALLREGDTTGANAAFDEVLRWLAEREAAGQTTYQLYRELQRNRAWRCDS